VEKIAAVSAIYLTMPYRRSMHLRRNGLYVQKPAYFGCGLVGRFIQYSAGDVEPFDQLRSRDKLRRTPCGIEQHRLAREHKRFMRHCGKQYIYINSTSTS
jgi:hypothetical protein